MPFCSPFFPAGACARWATSHGCRAPRSARLGPIGVVLHQAACGEPIASFVPAGDAWRVVERSSSSSRSRASSRCRSCWRGCASRCRRGSSGRSRRGRVHGAAARDARGRRAHVPLPATLRDARVFRTLILRDLKSHPPPAAIDWVEVEAGVVPGAIAQGSLLARALPRPPISRRSSRACARSPASLASAPPRSSTGRSTGAGDECISGRPGFRVPGHRSSLDSGRRSRFASFSTPEPRNPEPRNHEDRVPPFSPSHCRPGRHARRRTFASIPPRADSPAGACSRVPGHGARRGAGGRSIGLTGIATSGTSSWPWRLYRLAKDRVTVSG